MIDKVFVSENGREFLPAEHLPLLHALEVSVLCNNAELPDLGRWQGPAGCG